jgi:hypothetical protein
MAAQEGHLRAVKILLDHSADKEAKIKVRGSSDGNLATAGTIYDLTYHIESFVPIYERTYIHT